MGGVLRHLKGRPEPFWGLPRKKDTHTHKVLAGLATPLSADVPAIPSPCSGSFSSRKRPNTLRKWAASKENENDKSTLYVFVCFFLSFLLSFFVCLFVVFLFVVPSFHCLFVALFASWLLQAGFKPSPAINPSAQVPPPRRLLRGLRQPALCQGPLVSVSRCRGGPTSWFQPWSEGVFH